MRQYSTQIKGLISGEEGVDAPVPILFEEDYGPIDEDDKVKLDDQSSIWHLESYRSMLMSQLSHDDALNSLKIVRLPEVFADPPIFSIKNFLRSQEEDADETTQIMARYEGRTRPMRNKPLLEEYLRESELDPSKTLSFTTNSNLFYNSVKLVEQYLNWHFTKSLNVNMFHLQF